MSAKFGFIGAGALSSVVINAFVEKGEIEKDGIVIFDTDAAKTEPYKKRGFHAVQNISDLVKGADIVFLSSEEENVTPLLQKIKGDIVSESKTLVCFSATMSLSELKGILGSDCSVIRAIPCITAEIGMGITVMSYELPVRFTDLIAVKNALESCGTIEIVDDSLVNSVAAVTSAGIPMVYALVRNLNAFCEAQGLESELVDRVVLRTVLGAASSAAQNGKSADDITEKDALVSVPVSEAVSSFTAGGFDGIVKDALGAYVKKAKGE